VINRYFLEFGLTTLYINKTKNLFIAGVLTFLVFLVMSFMFISSSIKYELKTVSSSMPDIIVSKTIASKQRDIELDYIYKILDIKGVKDVIPRVWGFYRFDKAGVNFTIIGLDNFDYDYIKPLKRIAKLYNFNDLNSSMIVGEGVKKILDKAYYKDEFSFITPKNKIKNVKIIGEFDSDISLFSNDVIVLKTALAKEILGIKKNYVTDLVVEVPNKDEIQTIATKIKLLNPYIKVLTMDDINQKYQEIFDYKSGVFLALFLVSIFTFFIVVSERLSGVSSEEKKEVAILKAIGWKIDEIIYIKFIESFYVASISFILGCFLALFYVYVLDGVYLRDIFLGFSDFKPSFEFVYHTDISVYAVGFFITVPIYVASVIIPSWRVAVMDVDEVLR